MASAADVFAVATPSCRANGWRSANDLVVGDDVALVPVEDWVFVLLRNERMIWILGDRLISL